MSLWLKDSNYVNPYFTNWNYLDNMTALQMKALGTMLWSEDMEYIYTGLKNIPRAWAYEEPAKRSVKGFINDLNNEIKRL
jgi:hypothetical protein